MPVPLDKIRDVIAPIHLVLERCDKSVLMELYGIAEFRNVADLLRSVAEKRGKLLRVLNGLALLVQKYKYLCRKAGTKVQMLTQKLCPGGRARPRSCGARYN